ncbi:type IV pilin protein [Rubrivivax gelatinosus]|uniref:Type IV pilus assembly protein PilE n=1 Tax=Rubrivivax gelatinosus TaxID=28068 RepID=A0A4R2M353_RUBGE|nr:type IV pilin protein [Rubrivivax gelatinosus]MBK1690389.1 pilus assembly protein PilE [Rubrivivax gelatinosus]TCP01559.1 type IV pilus assembly protein PilE [Rubrivivax gelatinosus]
MNTPAPGRAARGFSLIELMSACTIAAVVAGLALPSWQGSLLKSRRADAVQALTRLQAAQEQYRGNHGHYAATLETLRLGPRSEAGHYTLMLERESDGRYHAAAAPAPGGAQQADHDCAPLTLAVDSGFVRPGPTRRCWNR